MCLIAHRDKPGSHVTNDIIEHNRVANPDGFGLMYRSNSSSDGRDGLVTRNFGPDEFAYFYNELKAIDATDIEYGAHWRFGTQGPNNKAMSHPFAYTDADGEPIAVMHNGIINIDGPKQLSDTKIFVDRILSGLRHEWWKDPTLEELVENAIGWSRLLIMTPRETVLLNGYQWKREQGVNYSTTPIWTFASSKGKVAQTRLPFRGGTQGKLDPFPLAFDDDEYVIRKVPKTALDLDIDVEPDEEVIWSHSGHICVPYSEFKGMGVDHEGVVVCEECDTEGDFYVIDGNLYIDISHMAQGPWENSTDPRFLTVGIQ